MNEDSDLSFVDASLKYMQWSYTGLSPELYQDSQKQNQVMRLISTSEYRITSLLPGSQIFVCLTLPSSLGTIALEWALLWCPARDLLCVFEILLA